MRGQSSLCLRCATVSVDPWVSQVSRMLHEGVISRPIVLTVPERRRETFYQQSQAVLSPFMRCGVRCWDDVFSRVRGRPLQGGDIVVIQTHGRPGRYKPQLHMIATRGDWEPPARQWHPRDDVPYRLLRQQGPWPLLTMRRQTGKTDEMDRLGEVCYTRYREGVVTNVHKGEGPSRSQSWAPSLAPYVVSPPSAVRRIDRYAGHRGTYHYRSHKTERVEREPGDVETLIGRMVPPVFPKGLQRVRSYGVQATKPCAQLTRMMQDALAKLQGIVKGASKLIAAKTYRERSQQRTGRDPWRCPHCHHERG